MPLCGFYLAIRVFPLLRKRFLSGLLTRAARGQSLWGAGSIDALAIAEGYLDAVISLAGWALLALGCLRTYGAGKALMAKMNGDEPLMARDGPPIEHEKVGGFRRLTKRRILKVSRAQGTIRVMVAKSPDDEPGPADVERTLD
jgi:hypothetical protein